MKVLKELEGEPSPVNIDGVVVSRSVHEHAPMLRSPNHRRADSHYQLNVMVARRERQW